MALIKRIFCIFSKYTVCLFYDRKYLKGRWFEKSTKGYRWCWKDFFMQKIVGYNRHIPYPVSHRNNFGVASHIQFNLDDLNNFQNFGCYFQAFDGNILIGDGTYIAPNVGIITQNHNSLDLNKHDEAKDVIIGKNCWIGMNSILLPGVCLGNNTIVGAGSVVTKSFPEGNCTIVGNPAHVIKKNKKEEE